MIKITYNYAASKAIRKHPYKGVRNTPCKGMDDTPCKGYKTSLRMPCGRDLLTLKKKEKEL